MFLSDEIKHSISVAIGIFGIDDLTLLATMKGLSSEVSLVERGVNVPLVVLGTVTSPKELQDLSEEYRDYIRSIT